MRLVMDNGEQYDLVQVNHGAYVSMYLDSNFWYITKRESDIIDPDSGKIVIKGTILYQYNCLLIDRKYYIPQKIKSK